MPALSQTGAMARLFTPTPGSSLADAVSQQLTDAIHLGLLARGEQLPSESALASQLGVSTVTLREALASLRNEGLVETRRGRHGGSFVCGPPAASTSKLRSRLRDVSVVGLRDLGDEWMAVAGASARLAARRASVDDIGRLRALADRLARSRSIGDRSRAHSRFGIEMALASRSERLTRAELRLHAEVGELLWLPTASALDAREVAGELHAVVDAVAAEDADGARRLAEDRTQRNTRWLIAARLALPES